MMVSKLLTGMVMALALGNASAAAAVATVANTFVWGIGLAGTVSEAATQALQECARAKSKMPAMQEECAVTGESSQQGGGSVVQAANGVIFNVGAKSELEAVNEAYVACEARYRDCPKRATVSWYEIGGMLQKTAGQ